MMDYVNLSDVCEIVAGQSPPSSTYNKNASGLPFFQGKADFGELYPNIRMWCSEPKKVSFPNDILISVRAPVGPTNINNVEACIGRGLSAIRCSDEIALPFLLHFLRYNEEKIADKGTGSTFKAITQKELRVLQIPLPPLPVQQKIAVILDTADALKQKDKALIAKYDELTQSLFLDMFGDPVTNPKGWDTIDFLDVFNVKTGKLNSNAEVKGGKYPFFTCSKEILSIDTFSYDCEALLLAGNNAAGVYDVKYHKGKFDAYQRTYILQIKKHELTYSFMQILLERKLADLKRFSLGTNTKYITMKIFERLDFIIPPISLQNQFAERVEAIEKQKQQAQVTLQKSADLFNCLLQKAFKGELVS